MWQRFTERARKVVFYAQEEARRRGETEVDATHLLLGVLTEGAPAPPGGKGGSPGATWPPPPQKWRNGDNVAVRLLKVMDADVEALRAAVARSLPPDAADVPPVPDMQLTRDSKLVIDRAYDEARRLSNNYIGTEHLLLGLARFPEAPAGLTLTTQGITLERLRREVVHLQGGGSSPTTTSPTLPRPWWRLFGP